MKKLLLLFLCASLFALQSDAQTVTASFMHDGLQRNYEVYIPTNYTGTSAVPLILNFHGFTSNGSSQFNISNLQPIADTAGFIVVSPTGSPLGGLINHWNVGGFTSTSTVNDVSFASDLIDTIAANYNINLMRVYSTGFSNGGFFSHKLACELGSRITAIASVSGTFTPEMQTLCAPSHPTPVMQIHGTNDATVPYPGSTTNGGMESADSVVNYWVNYNNCNTTPSVTALPNTNTSDGSTVEHFVYSGGTAGVNVELLKITNGTHTWPGNVGANRDINAGLEIWKFFSRYTNTAVNLNEVKTINFQLFPNPIQDYLNIQNPSENDFTFQLYTVLGKKIKTGILASGQQRLDVSELPKGIYVLKIATQAFKIIKE